MLNQEALDYIKQNRNAGINDQVIRQNLVNAGWPVADIDSAFSNNAHVAQFQSPTLPLSSNANKVPVFKILVVGFIFLIVLAGVGWLLISHTKKITPTLLNQNLGDVKPTDTQPQDIDVLPMYGGYQKTAAEQKADTDFINTASQVSGVAQQLQPL